MYVGCVREEASVFEMIAASICREVHLTVLSSTAMASRVPRCLFGPPNPKETAEVVQEALDEERRKFAKRYGVNPLSEDKENIVLRRHDRNERSPRKRNHPYAKQTNIHDYWRARKICDSNKKTTIEPMKAQNKESPTKPTKSSPSK